MARPPSASDGSSNLVDFDPISVDGGADEIYEVELGVNPAIAATPTPGALFERQTYPSPAGAVPTAEDLRASLTERPRGPRDDPREGGRSPLVLLVVGMLGLGCAGVLTVGAAGLALSGIGAASEAGSPGAPEAPAEFGGVPVERGFRRGDNAPRGPAGRPGEPTP